MKVGIAGYKGRVGRILTQELQSGTYPLLTLAGGSSRQNAEETFPVFTDPAKLCQISDCIIDFTTPEATTALIKHAVTEKTSLIIGTTGLDKAAMALLDEAAKNIPIIFSANMSIGVNLLFALVEQAAARLDQEWDIEIFETHHKNKIDAPSGTALALGNAARKGRGHGAFVIDRTGKREAGTIGFAASRGGDVVGEHMVTFYGTGERLELGHKSADRSLYAKGALRAAEWIHDRPAGLYSMRDVLGIA